MGNLYRFIEPVVLFMLLEKGSAHGYELAAAVQEHQLTDSDVDRGGLYRTLRALEEMGHVTSTWDVSGPGPARRVYSLTPSGLAHLQEWTDVLGRMRDALTGFVAEATDALSARAIAANEDRSQQR
jgi:poly-beta-hydroxybutyrate-responsive repressor